MNKTEITPWWKLNSSSWTVIAVLGIFSLAFSLWPRLFDLTLSGVFRLADYRDWPWWYYGELMIVVGFSVRWFLLYVAFYNEELDERGREEAKRFLHLTGFLTGSMLLYTIIHRFNGIRILYNALWRWLGFGSFSWTAVLAFVLCFAFISLLVNFVWKWVITLRPES